MRTWTSQLLRSILCSRACLTVGKARPRSWNWWTRVRTGGTIALAAALTVVGGPAAATLLLDGDFVELPIDDSCQVGRFMGTGNSQGARYNAAGTGGASGRDFWLPGTPVYNYTIAVGGTTFRTNGSGWA